MRVFLLLMLGLYLTSCEKRSKIIVSDAIETFSEFPKEEKVEFRNLVEFPYGNPRTMEISGSTLVLGNYASGQEFFLHNYSLNTNKFSKPYITKGRGPGEIMGMANFGFYDNYLWINDFTGKKMKLVDKNKAILSSSDTDFKDYSFKENRFYRSILTDNLQYIGTGNETSKFKVQVIDLSTAKVVEEFGELKSYSKDLPLNAIVQASLTQTLLKPTRDKLVLGYIHTDIIEIFDLGRKESISLQGPEKFDLDFSIQNSRWIENKNTRLAFIGGAVTNENIYLLYSGKKFNEENSFRGNYIFVYDWEMNPVKKIILNREVYQISISEDGKELYSFDEVTGFIIHATIN